MGSKGARSDRHRTYETNHHKPAGAGSFVSLFCQQASPGTIDNDAIECSSSGDVYARQTISSTQEGVPWSSTYLPNSSSLLSANQATLPNVTTCSHSDRFGEGYVTMLMNGHRWNLALVILAVILQACASSGPTRNADGELEYSEVNQKTRDAEARKTLQSEPNSVVVFARGACCQSCSIGVRTKVATLAFIDQTRFNRGIRLDAKTQLVTLALKPGSSVVPVALKKAVEAAGFVPVNMYQLEGEQLKLVSLR